MTTITQTAQLCEAAIYLGSVIIKINIETPRFVVVEMNAWRAVVNLREFETHGEAKSYLETRAAHVEKCACLERIGDNNQCPIHGGIVVKP